MLRGKLLEKNFPWISVVQSRSTHYGSCFLHFSRNPENMLLVIIEYTIQYTQKHWRKKKEGKKIVIWGTTAVAYVMLQMHHFVVVVFLSLNFWFKLTVFFFIAKFAACVDLAFVFCRFTLSRVSMQLGRIVDWILLFIYRWKKKKKNSVLPSRGPSERLCDCEWALLLHSS